MNLEKQGKEVERKTVLLPYAFLFTPNCALTFVSLVNPSLEGIHLRVFVP